MSTSPTHWFVYIVMCRDGSLYTGISNDPVSRIAAHNAGKGAKYTKGRAPVVLKALYALDSKAAALKEEYRIKQLGKQAKIRLFNLIVKK